MAVALEFVDFIVPRHLIEQKYPGGWEQCERDNEPFLGIVVWFDDHLLRLGAMNSEVIENLVVKWTQMGFEPIGERDGERVWKDVCVVASIVGAGAPTMPCEWLAFTEGGGAAYLRGTAPGRVVVPDRR